MRRERGEGRRRQGGDRRAGAATARSPRARARGGAANDAAAGAQGDYIDEMRDYIVATFPECKDLGDDDVKLVDKEKK